MSDEPEGLTPEGQVVWSHVFGDESPIQTALSFLSTLIGASDVAGAWKLMDVNLRLWVARQWLWPRRVELHARGVDLDEAAAALAEPNMDHPLWAPFEITQLGNTAVFWSWVRLDHLGVLTNPRPIGPALELVKFVDDKYVGTYQGPTVFAQNLALVMRLTPSGWLVAGIGEQAAVADWPAEP